MKWLILALFSIPLAHNPPHNDPDELWRNPEKDYYGCVSTSSKDYVDVAVWDSENAAEVVDGDEKHPHSSFYQLDRLDFTRRELGENATLIYGGQRYNCTIIWGE